MYLDSLKLTVRLCPIVIGAVIFGVAANLLGEGEITSSLSKFAIIILLFVLRYSAYKECLPENILLPAPWYKKFSGFIFSDFLLRVLGATPVFIAYVLILLLAAFGFDIMTYFESMIMAIFFTAIVYAFIGISYCLVFASFGSMLPACLAGYGVGFEKAMIRSEENVRYLFFRLLFGPALLFVVASILVTIGAALLPDSSLRMKVGGVTVWFSVFSFILSVCFVSWAEVMTAWIISKAFLKVEENTEPVTSTLQAN